MFDCTYSKPIYTSSPLSFGKGFSFQTEKQYIIYNKSERLFKVEYYFAKHDKTTLLFAPGKLQSRYILHALYLLVKALTFRQQNNILFTIRVKDYLK